MNTYLENLNNNKEENNNFFNKLREYAEEYDVPIIQRNSLLVIQSIIKMKNVKRILEIGTAICYSALSFANVKDDVIIDTIERNCEMFDLAQKNLEEYNKLSSRKANINIIKADALELDETKLSTYDLIFIDAAKAQYQNFFNKYAKLLKDDGVIVTDNILFHGLVEQETIESKNLRNMVKKIDLYNHFLNTLDEYETFYIDSGDGLAITMRK